MSALGDDRITWRLTAAILGAMLLVLGVGLGILAATDIERFEEDTRAGAALIARVVGDYSASDLAFDDRVDSTATLEKLRQDPTIVSAEVRDREGKLFSTYHRTGEAHLDPGVLDVSHEIVERGERLGTLHLKVSTAPLEARIRTYVWTVASVGVGLAALAVVFAVMLQRAISRPILAAVGRREEERARAEQAERRYAQRLQMLHEIDQAILAARSLRVISESALAHLSRVVPCVSSSVVEMSPEDERPRVLAIHPKGVAPPEEGAPGVLSVPLSTEDEVIGALRLRIEHTGVIDPESRQIAVEVAELLALAVKQARLAEQVERHTERLERRVIERTAQLQASNREMERFAYSVAHDLRSPLRAMQGFGTALLEDYGPKLDEQGRDYLTRIVASSERMGDLIHDLLEYSRLSLDNLELTPVPLATALAEARAQIDPQIASREVELVVEGGLALVLGHRLTLVQVLVNLLSNAIKFVPPGARPRIVVRTDDLGERVRLWVEDNGIGIAREHHGRIFQLFERLHGRDTYPGTGIGLAIVSKAVERMGGDVGVESELGRGSRFWVELSRAE